MIRRRIAALECLLGAAEKGPTLDAVVADCQRLDKWLAAIGMTASEALAAGLIAPSELGLRWTSLACEAAAPEAASAYRRKVEGRR